MAAGSGASQRAMAARYSASPCQEWRLTMSSSEPHLIHLVDDDAAIRRSVGFMLKTSGYQVESYESGAELLKSSSGLDRGCILLDIRMPEMDGLQVQQALQQKGVGLPVVIMTGHGDVSLAVE